MTPDEQKFVIVCPVCNRAAELTAEVAIRLRSAAGSWNEPIGAVFQRARHQLKCSRCRTSGSAVLADVDQRPQAVQKVTPTGSALNDDSPDLFLPEYDEPGPEHEWRIEDDRYCLENAIRGEDGEGWMDDDDDEGEYEDVEDYDDNPDDRDDWS